MRRKYREGTWFAVPLDSGGYAVGLVARMAKHGVILCYFFGPKRESIPVFAEIASLRASDAVKVIRIGDLHLLEGSWPLIGLQQPWNRAEWPMPAFVRRDPLRPRAWRIRYSEDDPAVDVSKDREPLESLLEEDAMWGAGAVEEKLDRILV